MDFTFNVGYWAVIVLIAASVAFGVVVQLMGRASFANEWVLSAVAAGIGGFLASEFIVGFRDWQPVFDGLALVPAVVGGLLIGSVVAAAARYMSGSHYGSPQAI